MIRQKKPGVIYAKNLLKYIKCLNMKKRKELAWKSPFKIYFDRKLNDLLNEGKNYNDTLQVSSSIGTTQEDYVVQVKQAAKWRKKVSNADERLTQRMLKNHENKKNYAKYKIKWKCIGSNEKKWGKAATAYEVLLGKIGKCYKNFLCKKKIVKTGDGNCQFASVSTGMTEIGIFRSATTLREATV